LLVTLLSGDVEMFLWDGGCAFVGSSRSLVPLHSHQAIQLVYGTDAEVRLSPAEDGPWGSHRLALVASHQPHAMDATDISLGVTMFIEPETLEGRALSALCPPEGITSLDPAPAADALAEMFERFLARRGDTAVSESARRVVTLLTHGVEPTVVTNERIVRALAWITAHIREEITLDAVAAAVFLSPGRFPPPLCGTDGDGAQALAPVAPVHADLDHDHGRGHHLQGGA
jgi:AraC family transcriptional regulator